MASDKTATRRRYSAELKAQVMAQCEVPGASVAKVAMSHGINANVVHRWRNWRARVRPALPRPNAEFVPVSLEAPPAQAASRDIQIELRRGATTMTITWPVSAAAEFAAWMRELLR